LVAAHFHDTIKKQKAVALPEIKLFYQSSFGA
jgi:hypothetical protein